MVSQPSSPPVQWSDIRGIRDLFSWWLKPRAQSRDEAFRESVIRSTLAIIIVLGLLSFTSTLFVYRDPWALISFPTMHLVALLGCFASATAISRGNSVLAGWLLVLTVLFAADSLVLLARQGESTSGLVSAVPAFVFLPLVATLVLPRNTIIPVSLFAAVNYILCQFAVPLGDFAIPGLLPQQQIVTMFMTLVIEAALLRQLRVEFDGRLEAMLESIQQTELAREQAEASRQRAEEADQAKSQFLANMSHELRTPLNAIIGYSEAMLGGMAGEFTTQQTTLLGHVQHNSRRLLGLINDVLDLSKIESGSMELHITPVGPQRLINETVDGLRSLAQDKGIYLKVEFDEMIPEFIQTDTDKIQQILVNLISNAVKFTDDGGVTIKANVAGDLSWRLIVRDSGIGIPPDALEYIFDPFQQVDGSSTRKYRGTGLGLAIVKRLVEQMGGSITLDSELKKGSTFTIVLPFEAVRSREEAR